MTRMQPGPGFRSRGAGRAGRGSVGILGVPPLHPAWGVAVMAIGGALLILVNLAVAAVRSGPALWLGASALATVAAAAVFVELVRRRGTRWRGWMTGAAVVVGEANLVGLVLLTPDDVSAVGTSAAFALAAVYAGLYLTSRAVLRHVAVLAAVAVLAVTGAGREAVLATALTVVPVCIVLAFITHRLAVLLRQESEHDPLTGLLNRRGLYQRIGGLLPVEDRSWSVAVLDLDGFKGVNDRHGHEAGDRLLQEVSRAWSSVLPDRAVVARTGGDEFVVITPDPARVAVELVTDVRRVTPAPVGVSAGVSDWAPGAPLDHALRAADAALYEAKSTGRGRTVTRTDNPSTVVPLTC